MSSVLLGSSSTKALNVNNFNIYVKLWDKDSGELLEVTKPIQYEIRRTDDNVLLYTGYTVIEDNKHFIKNVDMKTYADIKLRLFTAPDGYEYDATNWVIITREDVQNTTGTASKHTDVKFVVKSSLTSGDKGFFGGLISSITKGFTDLIVNPLKTAFTTLIVNPIKAVLDAIVSGLVTLGNFIIDGVKAIFIPKQVDIDAFFSSMNTFFSTKLGFLWYPIEWITSVLNALISGAEQKSMNLGNYWGSPFLLRFDAVETLFPQYWNLIRLSLGAFTVMPLMSALYKKLMAKLKGDNSSDN